MALSDFLHPWRAPGDSRQTIYEPFIRFGDSVGLVGDKGCGKTTAACDFIFKTYCTPWDVTYELTEHGSELKFSEDARPGSDQVFGGLLTVNRPDTIGQTAVILDAENDHLEWKSCLEDTARTYNVSPKSETFDFFKGAVKWRNGRCTNWNDFDSAKYFMDTELIPDLVDLECGLLVIDSTHKLWSRDLNSPEWVTEGLGYLRAACRERGITLLALTHTSRNFESKLPQNRFLPRGTSQQENEFDVILGLERHIKEKILKLHLIKRRAGKWCDEYTTGSVALSPLYAGFGRVITNPWPAKDPRKIEIPPMTIAEKNLLSKLSETPTLLDEIPGNTTRNKKTLAALLLLELVELEDTPRLTTKGLKIKELI